MELLNYSRLDELERERDVPTACRSATISRGERGQGSVLSGETGFLDAELLHART